jgi:hypothetical protein
MEHQLFANQRYVAQLSVGAVAHKDVLKAIELFGTEVASRVRAELHPGPATDPPATELALP